MNNKKYKLLDDLPGGIYADTIIKWVGGDYYKASGYYINGDTDLMHFKKDVVEKNPNLFAKYLFTTNDGVDKFYDNSGCYGVCLKDYHEDGETFEQYNIYYGLGSHAAPNSELWLPFNDYLNAELYLSCNKLYNKKKKELLNKIEHYKNNGWVKGSKFKVHSINEIKIINDLYINTKDQICVMDIKDCGFVIDECLLINNSFYCNQNTPKWIIIKIE